MTGTRAADFNARAGASAVAAGEVFGTPARTAVRPRAAPARHGHGRASDSDRARCDGAAGHAAGDVSQVPSPGDST